MPATTVNNDCLISKNRGRCAIYRVGRMQIVLHGARRRHSFVCQTKFLRPRGDFDALSRRNTYRITISSGNCCNLDRLRSSNTPHSAHHERTIKVSCCPMTQPTLVTFSEQLKIGIDPTTLLKRPHPVSPLLTRRRPIER